MEPNLPGLAHAATELPETLAAALRAKGEDYVPRTEHRLADGTPRFTNRLILESSPYLLQHAHNPVSWSAWGEEALARAQRHNQLVLLSVGYSTCHWCHVMERESFEDLEIAAFINQHFVAIKVDREERPDVDTVYMTAVQLMTGHGGWPMTVVLTPDKLPVFAGTYFPARDGDRGARYGFLTVLQELQRAWVEKPAAAIAQGRAVASRLAQYARATPPSAVPGATAIHRGVAVLASSFDTAWGGFGQAPKFPRPVTLELLARVYRRTEEPSVLAMLVTTLEKMAAGGMYDQIGGGFHRYSVDPHWLVPHFEKMLYDQAQLVGAYLDGYQLTHRQALARVARETLDYVGREMTHPAGGFFSATDADSPTPTGESEEGWFFTWTPPELEAVLGAERGRIAAAAFGVTEAGNFEGRSILHRPAPLERLAEQLGVATSSIQAELDAARAQLYAARARRPPPLRDEKVLTAWNGLMISAFARGGEVLGQPDYLEQAARAARFVLEAMQPEGQLLRSWQGGVAKQAAFLDDYAFLIQGLLDLYEATGTVDWLRTALSLQAEVDARFADVTHGGYFFTSEGHEALLTRDKPTYDGAEPAATSVTALNLLRLEQLTGEQRYRRAAERLFGAHAEALAGGFALPKMLGALDYYLDRPLQVVLVGQDAAALQPLRDVVRQTYLPNRALVVATEEALPAVATLVPLVEGKVAQRGKASAYLCRGQVCELPTTDASALGRELARADVLPAE